MLVQNFPTFGQEALAHRGDRDETVNRLKFAEDGELRRYPYLGCSSTQRLPIAHAGHSDGASQQPFFMPSATRHPRGCLPS